MLTSLTIQDVVLIERLDLELDRGLTVLTGETGAGKSILLDGLGLALGARAEQGLVRVGTEQAVVTATFAVPPDHPAAAILAEHGIDSEDELVLRRVLSRDGRSRAFVNDSPVGATLLRRLAPMLVEVQGQHDQMGLADPAGHGRLLDSFGVADELRAAVADSFRLWRSRADAARQARADIASALREQDFLRHAVGELGTLAPEAGEEETLAAERQRLQRGERRAETIAAALSELAPQGRDRRNPGPAAGLRAAARALQRLPAPSPAETDAMAALERAEEALADAERLLTQVNMETGADPRALERAEERLFALRGMARKHNVSVPELPALLADMRSRLDAIETGEARIGVLEAAEREARAAFESACNKLSEARRQAATSLDRAVARELPPLKLERARFVTDIAARPAAEWNADGADEVRFLIATNPGQSPGALGKVASGGELSRLMLALKVVLAGTSAATTLVFDEVDSGIGGATAAAVGERLARLASRVQVLLVTHSPQVAARGMAHLRVSKRAVAGRAQTRIERLDDTMRREEIARMLAGETVTDAARAAADSLLL